MNRRIKEAWVIAGGLLWSAAAHAAVISQNVSLDTFAAPGGSPSVGAPAPYELFDESLGTLNYVDVRIAGTWRGTGSFGPCLCQPVPTGGLLPAPYQVTGSFRQEIDELGPGRDIGFLIAPNILFNATVPTSLSVMTHVLHDMTFRFDAASDVFGITSVTGGTVVSGPFVGTVDPPVVQGSRADFIGAGPAFFLNAWQSSFQMIAPGAPTVTFSHSYTGTLSLAYDYTPHDDGNGNGEPVVPVHEPPSLGLLALGLLIPLLGRRSLRAGH